MNTDVTTHPGLLPRGRHGLSPEVVAHAQRERLIDAVVDRVADQGYAQTTVGHIVRAARVSRETFYALFADKLDCYTQARSRRPVPLLADAFSETPEALQPPERLELALTAYFSRLVAEPTVARCFLVEGPGRAGRPTAEDRAQHEATVRALLTVAQTTDAFAADAVVRTVASLVEEHLGSGRTEELLAKVPAIVGLAGCSSF